MSSNQQYIDDRQYQQESNSDRQIQGIKPKSPRSLKLFNKIIWIYQNSNKIQSNLLSQILIKNLQIIYGNSVISFTNPTSAIQYISISKKTQKSKHDYELIKKQIQKYTTIPKYFVICTNEVLGTFVNKISKMDQVYRKCVIFRGACPNQYKQYVYGSIRQIHDLIKIVQNIQQMLIHLHGANKNQFDNNFNIVYKNKQTVKQNSFQDDQYKSPQLNESKDYYAQKFNQYYQQQNYNLQLNQYYLKQPQYQQPVYKVQEQKQEKQQQQYQQKLKDDKKQQNGESSYIIKRQLDRDRKVCVQILQYQPYIYVEDTAAIFVVVVGQTNKQYLQSQHGHDQFKIKTVRQLDNFILNQQKCPKIVLISSQFLNLYQMTTTCQQVTDWIICAWGLKYLQTEEQKQQYQQRYAKYHNFLNEYMIHTISTTEELNNKIQQIQQKLQTIIDY